MNKNKYTNGQHDTPHQSSAEADTAPLPFIKPETPGSETSIQPMFTRRGLLKAAKVGGVGVAALVATGGILAGIDERDRERRYNRQPNFSFGQAEQLRTIYETEGFESLVEFFRISQSEYSDSSDFSEALAYRIEAWMTADCNPESVLFATPESLTGDQSEDIVGYAAMTALAGEETVNAVDGDLTESPLYKKITALRHAVHELYLTELGRNDGAPKIVTNIIRDDITTQDPSTHETHRAIDLEYDLHGDWTYHTIAGSLNLVVDSSSNDYILSLDPATPDSPFTFARG